MKIRFTKMHGLGNDFVVVDARNLGPRDWKEQALRLLDRRFGVGGDQLMVLEPSVTAHIRMRIFERDGLETEMCGNGIRAVARFLLESGLRTETVRVETLGGLKTVGVESGGLYRVDMGKPAYDPDGLWGKAVDLHGESRIIHVVSMGNPHAVIFVDRPEGLQDVTRLGPILERHPLFPNRTNAEFVFARDPGHLDVRVWERGAGETMACGTGSCASGVAAIATGRAKSPVRVRFKGGELEIHWTPGGAVFMTGPAARVFDGEIEL
jgi:diaminopimelate epimerase